MIDDIGAHREMVLPWLLLHLLLLLLLEGLVGLHWILIQLVEMIDIDQLIPHWRHRNAIIGVSNLLSGRCHVLCLETHLGVRRQDLEVV